mgnify:CR=1 FL=1
MESKFLTSLDGRWLDDKRFMLLADLIYQSNLLKGSFVIPKGFVTDFASVPRVPVAYTLFGNRAHHESVPHDYFYQTHRLEEIKCGDLLQKNTTIGKATADKIFLEAMEARGKSKFVRYAMYWGVVLGGYSSYKSGQKRFIILNP